MPGTFGYTEATNIVVVTGGTSSSPADFPSFVTADRAGTDTLLLSAGSPASDLALTYAVRSVEDLAILVKCVVANKSAEADFIFITGKDWRGAAQTESIDITAGNGSYTTAKYWSEITTLDCSDNANGGGVVWADGDLSVTQDIWGVIWDYGGGQYKVDCWFDIGNDSTTTHFQTKNEDIYFVDDIYWKVRTHAYFYCGEIVNNEAQNGSSLNWWWPANEWNAQQVMYGSTIKIGASKFTIRAASSTGLTWIMDEQGCLVQNCIFLGSTGEIFFIFDGTHINLKHLYFDHVLLYLSYTPETLTDIKVNRASYACGIYSATATVRNLAFANCTHDVRSYSGSLTVLDAVNTLTNILIQNAIGVIGEQYSTNIHIANKDGANLVSASVACEYANLVEGSDSKTYKCIVDHTAIDADHKPITGTSWSTYWELYDAGGGLGGDWDTGFAYKSGATEFTTQTTDAIGDITEQNVQYRKWVGTSEIEERRLHKFTISKAGYKTLVLENITVDGPIDWHLSLDNPVGAFSKPFVR